MQSNSEQQNLNHQLFSWLSSDSAVIPNQFTFLADNINQAILMVDGNQTIHYANPAAIENFGYTATEIKKLDIGALLTTPIQDGEILIRTKSGKKLQFHLQVQPAHIESKHQLLLLKAANDELLNYTILSHTEESFVIVDKDHTIIEFNEQFKNRYLSLLGKEIKQGDSILTYVQPGRESIVKEIYQKVFNGERLCSEIEIPLPDGHNYYYNIYKPALNQKGEIWGAFVSSHDITAQKNAQLAIQKSEHRYKAMAENGQDMVLVIDQNGKTLTTSENIEKLLGYSRQQTQDFNLVSLLHPLDTLTVKDSFKKCLHDTDQSQRHSAIRIKHANGAWRWIELNFTNYLADEAINGIVCSFRDITEKILAENKAQFEVNNKLALINNTDSLIWSINKNFELIAANNAFLKSLQSMTGIRMANGHSVLTIPGIPESFTHFWGDLYRRGLNGECFTEEIHTPAILDTPENWSEISFNPIYQEEEIVGVACYGRQTTEKRQFQIQLQNLNEKLTKAQNIAQIGYWELNLVNNELYWTEEVYKIWGQNRQQFVLSVESYLATIHPDDLPVLQLYVQNAINNNTDLDFEHRIILPDGRIRIIHQKASIVFQQNKPFQLEGTVQDITDRKRLELEKQKLVHILEKSLNEIYIFDSRTLRFEYINQGALKNLGYSMSQMREKTPLNIKPRHTKETFNDLIDPLLNGSQEKIIFETVHQRADASLYPVEVHLQLVNTGLSKVFLAVILDMTEKKRDEEQLKQLNQALINRAQELANSNRELEQFAYVASHDLQEPLRMVSSFLQLLQRKYATQLDQEAQEFISYAVDGAERMKQLILDLLQFSKLGTDSAPSEKVNLNETLAELVKIFEVSIKENKAEISIPALPIVPGNRMQLSQLFQNLISNALKYRNNNKNPKVTITVQEHPDHWHFEIQDNGIGIDERFYDKVFIIFQRLHNKRDFNGTGIGLAICKKIVELHGGTIGVRSIKGQGSTFFFSLNK